MVRPGVGTRPEGTLATRRAPVRAARRSRGRTGAPRPASGRSETRSPRSGAPPRLDSRDEPRLLARDLGRAEDERVRADLLDHLDARRDPVRRELERLGAQADDDARAGRSAPAPRSTRRRATIEPLPPSGTSQRFIAGEPMKPATNMFDRPVVELARRAALLQLPVREHGDAVPERHRLRLVVRHVHRRRRRSRTGARRCRRASARAASRRGSRAARPSGRRSAARTIARPIATRCRWPPESWPGLRSRYSSRPSSSRDLAHARLALGLLHLRDAAAGSRCSAATVRYG